MIFDICSLKELYHMPHKAAYDRWMERLSDREHQLIIEAVTQILDTKEIIKSSWIPGKDWSNTVYHPIYAACDCNEESAALFFGLLVWEAALNHDSTWAFGKYDIGGGEGLTYYRVDVYRPN